MVININDKYFNLNIYLVVMFKFLLNLIPASFWFLFALMFVMAFESGEFAVGFSVFCLGGI